MVKAYKCWVNTRVEDWTEGGALQLGQVLKDPLNPNSACIPSGSIVAPPAGSVEWSKRVNVQDSTKDETIAGFRAWLHFFNLPFGTAVEAERKDSSEDTRRFKSLRTAKAIFDVEYVQAVLDTKAVMGYMKHVRTLNVFARKTKHLWMITGVRVGNGATKESIESHEHNVLLKGRGDASVAGISLQAGVDTYHQSTYEHSQSSGGGTGYVFQYRVERVNKDFNLINWNKGHSETTGNAEAEEGFDFEMIADEKAPLANEDLEQFCSVQNLDVRVLWDEQADVNEDLEVHLT